MDNETRRTYLESRIAHELDLAQVERVHDYIDALQRPLRHLRLDSSWLATKSWTAEFTSRIQAHHAVNRAPLTKTTFEDAFSGSCISGGYSVENSSSTTNRFWDVRLNGKGISLKTTAAQNLNTSFIHISKLTEAAWIQDQRSASGRRSKTIDLVREFRSNVSSIIILRCFKLNDGQVKSYELVEIPGELLDSIEDAPKEAFLADGPTIPLPYGSGAPDLSVKLDRSDSKITLAKIRVDRCLVHVSWSFPET